MVTLSAWQSCEIRRLGLKEYLAQPPHRKAWHGVAQEAIGMAKGNEELAAKLVGVLAAAGYEDSADLLHHIKSKDEAFDTSDNQKVECFFTRVWGPFVILDFKQTQNGGNEDEQG